MSTEIVHIENASIGFGGKRDAKVLLNNLNLSVNPGEFIVLAGANGSGKSTLMKSIAGLIPLHKGIVNLNGKSVSKIAASERAKLVSMVFATPVSNSGLTGFELVSLGRQPYSGIFGKLVKEDFAIIDTAFEQTNTSHLAHRQLFEMSDGEQQKLMIARALAQNTPLILLDEPTAFLDVGSRVEILQLLKQLSKNNNKTIIFSSHDVQLAFQLSQKVWLIDNCGKLHEGAPEEILKKTEWINGVLKDKASMDSGNFQIIL